MNSQWASRHSEGILATNKAVLRRKTLLKLKRNFAFFRSSQSINLLLHFFTIDAANEPEQFRNFYSIRYSDETKIVVERKVTFNIFQRSDNQLFWRGEGGLSRNLMSRQNIERKGKEIFFSYFRRVSLKRAKTYTIKKSSKKNQNSINIPGNISIYIDVTFIRLNNYSWQNYESFYGFSNSNPRNYT